MWTDTPAEDVQKRTNQYLGNSGQYRKVMTERKSHINTYKMIHTDVLCHEHAKHRRVGRACMVSRGSTVQYRIEVHKRTDSHTCTPFPARPSPNFYAVPDPL